MRVAAQRGRVRKEASSREPTMRVRRKRIYLTVAMLTVVAFTFLRKGASSSFHRQVQLEANNVDTLKFQTKSMQDEGSLVGWSHPSVFQQWREHQPPPLLQSASEDCLQLKGFLVQQTCLQRLQHVRQYCSKRQAEEAEDQAFSDLREDGSVGGTSINTSVVDVFSYQRGDSVVMYCSVHKVASTFWIRLFRFLHNDTSGSPVSSPELLSKYKVHLTAFKQSRPLALAYITRKLQPEKQQYRFMFTRNPYHRLWAVYIDKFVLPDFFFWSYHANMIQDMIRETSDSGETQKSLKSCFAVTFEDFVEYTVQDESSPFAHSEDHILPVSRVCNPCAFQPHFIGHLENMTVDSQTVLERLNLSHIVRQREFQEMALNHMQTITAFVYETVDYREGLRHCVSDEDLQAKLIRAFILSGYLPPEAAAIDRAPVISSPHHVFSMVRQLFLDSGRSKEEVEAQRKQFMVNAYESLPWDLLCRVRDYYKEDFDMFGYDLEPPELFAHRQERDRSTAL